MDQKHILVVDDNPDIVRLITLRLEQEGFATSGATSGAQALKLLEGSFPDLVLLDIVMPGLTGFEVCQQIKANPRTRNLPVVMLSARDSTGDKVHGLEQGADEYVTKPVRLAELVARVRALLRLKSLEEELALKNAELKKHLDDLRQASVERAKLLGQVNRQNQRLQAHALAEREFLDLLAETLAGPLHRLERACEQLGKEPSADGRKIAAVQVVLTEARRLQGSLERLPHYLERMTRPGDRRARDRREKQEHLEGRERRRGERRQAARRRTDLPVRRAKSHGPL
jgi:DNA-binding response OmpR family regulator